MFLPAHISVHSHRRTLSWSDFICSWQIQSICYSSSHLLDTHRKCVVSMLLKELHYWTIITCSPLLLFLRYELIFCNIVEHHFLWFIIQLCWYQQIDNALHYQHQAMQYNRIEFVEEEIESDELTVKTYRL